MSGRGYFEEDSGLYRNNTLSAVLREDHLSSMKSAVGFVCVWPLLFFFLNDQIADRRDS